MQAFFGRIRDTAVFCFDFAAHFAEAAGASAVLSLSLTRKEDFAVWRDRIVRWSKIAEATLARDNAMHNVEVLAKKIWTTPFTEEIIYAGKGSVTFRFSLADLGVHSAAKHARADVRVSAGESATRFRPLPLANKLTGALVGNHLDPQTRAFPLPDMAELSIPCVLLISSLQQQEPSRATRPLRNSRDPFSPGNRNDHAAGAHSPTRRHTLRTRSRSPTPELDADGDDDRL